jgi:hypothetical protein
MMAAIVVVWGIGLFLALGLTGLAVLHLLRIVELALDIRRLAQRTLPGAQGIAANTAAVGDLAALAAAAGRLAQAAQTIERATAAIERRVSDLVRRPREA